MKRLLLLSFIATTGSLFLKGKEHYVKEGQSIRSAIQNASSFDTIRVEKGLYHEHSIIVDKPLHIMGNDNPVVDAQNEKVELFIIAADSVILEGFTLKNVGVSFLKELSAIKVRNSKYGSIKNNSIEGSFFAIYLEYAQSYSIINNQVKGTSSDEASAGNAIHVWKGDDIEIFNNLVTGHRDGIYFEFVDNSRIYNNKSYGNIRYGLHFMFSNDDKYIGNTFKNNGAGVAVMFSKNITMNKNEFRENWGGASYGLLLKEISDGSISENKFIKNTTGILAEGANRLEIHKNGFINNGKAIDMKGNCLDNKVRENNFIANTYEVVTNSQYNTNTYEKNYWSGYSGYDLDKDGFGDLPYRPVNVFSRITEKIPSATLMLNSLMVSIIELTEKAFPTLIPEELTDQMPKMRPYTYD